MFEALLASIMYNAISTTQRCHSGTGLNQQGRLWELFAGVTIRYTRSSHRLDLSVRDAVVHWVFLFPLPRCYVLMMMMISVLF